MSKEPEKEESDINTKEYKEGAAPPPATPLPETQKDQAAVEALREAEQEPWDPKARQAFLEQLTSYQGNPKLGAYWSKIRHSTFHNFGDQYARNFRELGDQRLEFLAKQLPDKIVVDLGGGYTLGPGPKGKMQAIMQDVAQELGAKTYVNVDRHFKEGGSVGYDFFPEDVTDDLGIPQPAEMNILYVQEDMLAFLAHMPSESQRVVLTLNGIDGFVIPGQERGYGSTYFEMLAQEIARVLLKGGVILTCGSEDITKYFKKLGLEVASGFPDSKNETLPQAWIKK